MVKICKEAVLQSNCFLRIFDETVNLITNVNNDVRDQARKVDDLLKDVVHGALLKNCPFDLDALLNEICKKLFASKNPDVLLLLIKWIEILHSITNVDILKCVPRFLEKFLIIIGTKGKT